MDRPPFVRTKEGCFRLHRFKGLGTTYKKVEDPKGQDYDEQELRTFYLDEQFPKVPLEDLQRIVSFYRQYMTNLSPNSQVDTNEVQVILLRDEETLNRWKVVVPVQVISPVTVEAITSRSCDLATGEQYEVFPPIGWLHGGSSHSHNNMGAFFSGKDDAGELGVPGLHFVIGRITKTSYDIKASIVVNKVRYIIDPVHVIGLEALDSTINNSYVRTVQDDQLLPVHENVHAYVSRQQYTARKVKAGSTYKGKTTPSVGTLSTSDRFVPRRSDDAFFSDFEDFYNYGGFDPYNTRSKIQEEQDQKISLITKAYFLLEDMAQEEMKEELFALMVITGFIRPDKAADICGGTYFDTAEEVARYVFSDELSILDAV